MREEPKPTTLPKPISEMSDAEVAQVFPRDEKKLRALGVKVTDHGGLTIELSAAAAAELLAALAEPESSDES